jgi:hypothetical protein
MKPFVFACAILPLLPAAATADGATDGTAGREAVSAIKQAFPYAASPSPATGEKPAADDHTVAMERFIVVAQGFSRPQREMMESDNQKIQDRQFSLIKGGARLKKDLGKARIELGAWAAGPVMTFLRISW